MFQSPVGELLARVSDDRLSGLWYPGQFEVPAGCGVSSSDAHRHPLLVAVGEQLDEYFAGERREFDLGEVDFSRQGSVLQQRVWRGLLDIGFGQTVTYAQLAEHVGLGRNYARVVGQAVGRNPVSIVAPCHRVVGAAGKLTGYAGGLDRKEALLRLEGVIP